MSQQVSREEYDEWLQHPVTRAFRESMHESREELKEALARGAYKSHEQQAHVRGQCDVMLQIETLDQMIEVKEKE